MSTALVLVDCLFYIEIDFQKQFESFKLFNDEQLTNHHESSLISFI